jgi:aconitate hydratase
MASAGDLTFNPVFDTLIGSDGKPFEFSDLSGRELPPRHYDPSQDTFYPPLAFGDSFQHTLPGWCETKRALLY